MSSYKLVLLFIGLVLVRAAWAEPQYQSQYAGQETRRIKSLSDDDLFQLKNGKGWGLAKAAELNGVPGPAHILEMKQEIQLTPSQETQIRALYEQMRSQAITLGEKLIEEEARLNTAFVKREVTEKSLERQLQTIADVRRRLRYVHLATHLKTPGILTEKQIEQYNQLRGYLNNADPCQNMPAGHDAEMWKKHNGCQ